jgi:tRNA (adenine57-N1/adenine58-N1)-methyltransferase catalytic subunit
MAIDMSPFPGSIQSGQLAMLVGQDAKRFILRLETGGVLETHRGRLMHDELLSAKWGAIVESHLGHRFALLQPALGDLLLRLRRRTQIIYPKDAGYLITRMSITPGQTMIEAGSGSGGLTIVLAWAVGPGGMIHSYDRRPDLQSLARTNLRLVGLEDRVQFHLGDLADGLGQQGVDGVFLDLPRPEAYLSQVVEALRPGGAFGAILPTTNQVSALIQEFSQHYLYFPEVAEILLRFYKPVPARLRPVDRMTAHTGFLVFARRLSAAWQPEVVEETPGPRFG